MPFRLFSLADEERFSCEAEGGPDLPARGAAISSHEQQLFYLDLAIGGMMTLMTSTCCHSCTEGRITFRKVVAEIQLLGGTAILCKEVLLG